MKKNKAIFLDRDGVLIKDTHLVTNLEQVEFIDGVEDALTLFQSLGYKLIVVTNQSVVSRGLLTLSEAEELNVEILKSIAPQIKFSQIYLCPYHPHAQVEDFREDHNDRKPRPGMLLKGIEKEGLDPVQCYMVGDRPSDILAGKAAGCQTVALGDYSLDKMIHSDQNYSEKDLMPDEQYQSLWGFAQSLKAKVDSGSI